METLTIAKVIYTKEVEGKFGPQHNVRFTTNEHGEQSVSGFFTSALKEGQQITGEIVKKPGTDKNGNEVVYWNFNPQKKANSGPNTEALKAEFVMINRKLDAIWTRQGQLLAKFDTKTAFDIPGEKGVEVKDHLADQFPEEEIDPADIPFD